MSENSSNSFKESFEEELKLIDEEISKSNDLFAEVVGEIRTSRNTNNDEDRNARTRGSSSGSNTFVSNMYEIANSIKSNKISLISQRITIKKLIEDFKIKSKDTEGSADRIKSIVGTLIKTITNNKENMINEKEVKIEESDELEKIALEAYEEAMKENPKMKEENNENNSNNDQEVLKAEDFNVTITGKIFKVNEKGELLEEIEDDPELFYIEKDEEGIVLFAKFIPDNKEIQLISIEE